MTVSVLVTGGDGFVGQRLCPHLGDLGYSVAKTTRSGETNAHSRAVGAIENIEDWRYLLDGIDVVVHLAGRAHVLRDTVGIDAYRKVNVIPARRLGEGAASIGVRQLIFVSSIGVNGTSSREKPFTEADKAAPVEPYAVSKYEAEQALLEIASNSELKLTIVRPPLIYGPGVKGNFLRLLKLASSVWPLPFGGIKNKRSFIGLQNFCGAIAACVANDAAYGQLFLLADGEDISTPELVGLLVTGLRRRRRIAAMPPRALGLLAAAAGRASEFERLAGSLQVDALKAREQLGWRPEVPLTAGISEMAEWYSEAVLRH